MLTVACVLKFGGCYNEQYVRNLFSGVKKNISYLFEFVCLNDFGIYNQQPLEHKLNGWWSKLELFKLTGQVIYIDLDSVILGSLDSLAEFILNSQKQTFLMSKSFRDYDKWSSNIMAWNGDFKFILEDGLKFNDFSSFPKGDQTFIWTSLEKNGVEIKPVQDYLSGIYSYKYHCRNQVPSDVKFISFHGKPKPHELTHLDLIKEHWKLW